MWALGEAIEETQTLLYTLLNKHKVILTLTLTSNRYERYMFHFEIVKLTNYIFEIISTCTVVESIPLVVKVGFGLTTTLTRIRLKDDKFK